MLGFGLAAALLGCPRAGLKFSSLKLQIVDFLGLHDCLAESFEPVMREQAPAEHCNPSTQGCGFSSRQSCSPPAYHCVEPAICAAADANDAAQFAELKTQGELTRRAWEKDVQVG